MGDVSSFGRLFGSVRRLAGDDRCCQARRQQDAACAARSAGLWENATLPPTIRIVVGIDLAWMFRLV
jgi:hypothetical protein